MASDPANSNRSTAKWALVGVLAVVLVGVVVWQFRGGGSGSQTASESDPVADKAERRERKFPRRIPAKGISLTPSLAPATKWPTMPLSQVVAHDPFAPEMLPAAAAASGASGNEDDLAAQQERATMLAETLDALRQRGVSMVLHSAQGPVATIGDRTIKVGDKVGDYRVTEIDADGVVLEPTPPK